MKQKATPAGRQGFAPILILLIVVAIGFVGYLSYKNNNTGTKLINPLDNICQTDSDCVTATTECSCDCGIPINKQNLDKYLTRKEFKCKLYFGKMCKMSCTQIPSCINNKCTIPYKQITELTFEPADNWEIYIDNKHNFEISFPTTWFYTDKLEDGFRLSNQPTSNSANNSDIPAQGGIFINFFYFGSAFENGIGKTEWTDSNGVTVISETKYISEDGNFGYGYKYRKNDPNLGNLLNNADQIISTYKFVENTGVNNFASQLFKISLTYPNDWIYIKNANGKDFIGLKNDFIKLLPPTNETFTDNKGCVLSFPNTDIGTEGPSDNLTDTDIFINSKKFDRRSWFSEGMHIPFMSYYFLVKYEEPTQPLTFFYSWNHKEISDCEEKLKTILKTIKFTN